MVARSIAPSWTKLITVSAVKPFVPLAIAELCLGGDGDAVRPVGEAVCARTPRSPGAIHPDDAGEPCAIGALVERLHKRRHAGTLPAGGAARGGGDRGYHDGSSRGSVDDMGDTGADDDLGRARPGRTESGGVRRRIAWRRGRPIWRRCGPTARRGCIPVTPMVSANGLFVFSEPDIAKGRRSARARGFALHNGVPDNDGTGGEFLVTGRAVEVIDDPATRAAAGRRPYEPKDRYLLFELLPDGGAVQRLRRRGVAAPDTLDGVRLSYAGLRAFQISTLGQRRAHAEGMSSDQWPPDSGSGSSRRSSTTSP